MYMEHGSHSGAAPTILALFAILALVVGGILLLQAAPVIYGSHAVAKHGLDAELVRECLEKNPPSAIWRKPDGRILLLCQLPDGRWGVQIRVWDESGAWREITSFIKNKMKSLEQVERWLRNMGAVRIH